MIRKFHLQRTEDESGVSGTGRVAEGVVFSNGWVAMTWLTRHTSAAVYTSLLEVEKIHGHSGKTKVVLDEDDYTYEPLEYRSLFELGRADNGWILREYETNTVIVASEDTESSEHKAFANLLWSMISAHGPSCGKYSRERLLAVIVPGSDYSGQDIGIGEVVDQASNHIDYALRFLENVNPSEKPENMQEIISKLKDAYDGLTGYNMN